ncbi:MAG: hypothetical protein DI535_05300 [Citrobacter freundii]|nr:MAG: hypothetical protein DI535_05300 [Citrobacter freundii]
MCYFKLVKAERLLSVVDDIAGNSTDQEQERVANLSLRSVGRPASVQTCMISPGLHRKPGNLPVNEEVCKAAVFFILAYLD